jgi:hypothetical protein
MKTSGMALALAGAALALSAPVIARPGGGGGGIGGAAGAMGHPMGGPTTSTGQSIDRSTMGPSTTSNSQGPTNGKGWDHSNGPSHSTGQPGAECGSTSAPNRPGNASSAPGSAFNQSGTAGTKYAGEQPQNSRNSASVSQYDSACLHQR